MKLIIKNSFLGKHVYDETGKEVCQISSHVMNPNQNILLIEQQKTYISSFERAGSNTALLLTVDEQGSKEHVVKGEANGNSEVKLYERSFHDLNVEDQRQNRHYSLHLNSDTSWQINDQQHQIGCIKKMDAYGNIQMECEALNDLLMLCAFYLFTHTLMFENEAIMV